MAAVRHLLKEMEIRTLVWLAKSRLSSLVIVGTLAAAGLGAAALSAPPNTPKVRGQELVQSTTLPMSAYGCYNDPDGDGHIFCDGYRSIPQLPKSYGPCSVVSYYGDGGRIVCQGTGPAW